MRSRRFSLIELLEARIAPATFTWDGSASTDWFDADNWTPRGVPGAQDTAVLDTVPNPGPLTLLAQFNAQLGPLVGAGFDPVLGRLWTYASSSDVINAFTPAGVAAGSVRRPGIAADDADVEFAPEALTLGGAAVPAGTLLFIDGESGTAEIYAIDKATGGVLATLNTAFGSSHVVGGAYHAGRNTFFLVSDRADATPNTIAEINPSTGAILNTFITGFDVAFGDLDINGATGHVLLVSSVESRMRALTPTGGLVLDRALPAGVSSLSGIAYDDARDEAYFSSTNGNVYRLDGLVPNQPFLGANTSVTTFQQSTGTFTSPAGVTLTILGNFDWTGGEQSGAGTTTVSGGATLSYTPNGNATQLTQHTLELAGTTLVRGVLGGQLALSNGATINNSGLFDINEIQQGLVVSGTGTFNNLDGATLKKAGGTFLFDNGIAFTNAGTVQALGGAIGFNGGYVQSAGSTELAGGTVSVSGTLALRGGTLTGAGMFTGSINNSGGIVQPGGAGTPGTITTNGDYTQGGGGTLETELGGTSAGQFDVFAVGGVASLAGTLTAPLFGGFAPPNGSQFPVITAGSSISGRFSTAPASVGIQYAGRTVTLLGPAGPAETIVTTESDLVNANDGVVSLREAITFANSNAGLDTITFNIPGAGLHSIRPTSVLPVITDPVVIDGFSQPGASANTGGPAAQDNAVRLIEVSGVAVTSALPFGLRITAGGSLIEGLIVTRWSGAGIRLDTAGGNTIAGNLIGADADGNNGQGNGFGISIANSPSNTIGGATPDARNRIVGNSGDGISISGPSATGNSVRGNFIGTDGSPTGIEGNRGSGVNITGGGGNTIGGITPGTRNIISGSGSSGVILKDSSGNAIPGNFIGTDVTGTAPIPNSRNGVFLLDAATNNVIGGTASGAGNVISANQIGVLIGGKSADPGGPATGNRVEGNYIGTNASGAVNLGNSGPGIRIENDAANNTIGGAATGAANVIAANSGFGIVVQVAVGAVGNAIQGNFIGTDSAGAAFLGNSGDGIGVAAPTGAPSGLAIGGTGAGEGNVIAFNARNGIVVDAPSRGVVILGNSIHDNNGLGIDLGTNGFTSNDAGDADTGANDLQNFPVLTSVTPFADGTTIGGTLNSAANATFRVEFFTADSVDGNGVGQGRTFAGFTNVTTDGAGNAGFSTSIASLLAPGTLVTATATQFSGAGTSEFAVARAAAGAPGIVVTTTLDVVDVEDGVTSLREAITFANSNAGLDTITFNIPGAAATVRTIAPASALPAITEAVVINGYSQPGASANTLATGNNATLLIELTGSSSPAGTNGLTITGAGSTIRGLIVHAFPGSGIVITGAGATGNIIEGNNLGTNSSGTADRGNTVHGVLVANSASGNSIGGLQPASRNLISGNDGNGILIASGADSNRIVGNYIGTNAAGTAGLGNSGNGIELASNSNSIGESQAGSGNVVSGNAGRGVFISGNSNLVRGNFIGTNAVGMAAVKNSFDGLTIAAPGSNNLIGGSVPVDRNVISGNDIAGVSIESIRPGDGFANGNRVQGNFIGVAADGVTALGNKAAAGQAGWGVIVLRQANDNIIGGTLAGQANLIAFNDGPGVAVVAGTPANNRISGNSIFSNGGLGIDLGNAGVTTNDANDIDPGPNGLLNFPTLTLATPGGATTVISGSYAGAPSATLTIDFYANAAADASGFGEGQTYLGSTAVTTAANGTGAFSFIASALTAGTTLTATATDAAGNTSEFSAAFLISGASTSFVWDAGGGADTNWFNALNWAPDGLPGVSDSAVLNSNATITLPGPAVIASFTQTDGILTGAGALTVNDLTWSGGTQNGRGMTVIRPQGFLTLEGAALKSLSQRTLDNAGTAVWTGSGDVQLSQGAIFNNTGSFEIQNDASFAVIPGNAQPRFLNSGTVHKTGGGGVTAFADLAVANRGTLRISSGTLALTGTSSFVQTGGMTVLSGGSLSATGLLAFDDGTLSGVGTIAAGVVNTGALLQPGGSKGAGRLSISGDYTQGAEATLAIDLGGTVPGSEHDQLVIGGAAILDGTLEINTLGSFAIPDGSSFDVLTYASFSGAFAALDAPSGVTAVPGSAGLLIEANTPAPGERSVTVTDVDGDLVTLKVNKGSIPTDAITFGPNGELLQIDLRSVGSKLGGANFTIDVEQAGGGDGAVNVGAIDASGMNLAKVRIAGDLGQIDIGTGDSGKKALKSLFVASLGTMGATSQIAGTENPLLSEVSGKLGKLSVESDVENAIMEVGGKLSKVFIGGNLRDTALPPAPLNLARGSSGVFLNGGIPPAGASHAGTIFALTIGSVNVMGDVEGGEISAEERIKKVKVVGSLRSDDPLDPAILRVGADIDKVRIQGDVQNALILAGYNRSLQPRNPDASIGKVTVDGDWTAASVVAGIVDPSDDGFGRNDTLIAGDDTPNMLSRIASVIIKGTATGSATPTDHSGITAQKIGKLRISDEKVPLTKDPDNVLLDPVNQNFRAVEIQGQE